MPRTETILSAFVASPGDVKEERELLEDIVRELNVTWRKTLGVSLDLLKWETHVTPGIADDPQKVINNSIGDDYDIFIGLMWSRFGTETSSHESGTEEEYSRAYSRWKAAPSSVRVMFYFNQAGVPVDSIDLKQVEKIRNFKNTLGDEGVLYWNYKDSVSFQELIRLHLSRVVQEWLDPSVNQKTSPSPLVIAEPSSDSYDEDSLGLLDLMEVLEDSISAVVDVVDRLNEAMTDVGEDATARGAELNKLERDDKGNIVDYKPAKRITNRAAEDLDRFSVRLIHEVPIFKEHNEHIARSSAGLALVMEDFDSESDEDLSEFDRMLGGLVDALATVPEVIEGLRDNVSGIPRVSVKYNRAKKEVVKQLDLFLDAIDESLTLYSEALGIMRKLREQHGQTSD